MSFSNDLLNYKIRTLVFSVCNLLVNYQLCHSIHYLIVRLYTCQKAINYIIIIIFNLYLYVKIQSEMILNPKFCTGMNIFILNPSSPIFFTLIHVKYLYIHIYIYICIIIFKFFFIPFISLIRLKL